MKSSNRQMLSQNADNLIDLFLCGILNYEIMETHLGGIMMDAIFSNYSPVFLYVNRYSFSDNWVYHESRVPYSLVRYICSGSARFEVDGDGYDVKEGSVFYIPQGCTLNCAAYERIVFISVRFIGSVQLPAEDMLKCLWNIGILHDFSDHPEMKGWFERIYACAVSRNTYKRLETRGYLNLILAALAQRSAPFRQTDDVVRLDEPFTMDSMRHRAEASHINTDPRIRVLVDYLTLNPQKNMSREEMCGLCGVSESSLRRLFREHTGKTIHEFVKELRMTYAAHRLVTTNDPVSTIGYELGYESSSYFTKTFRETFGVSPQFYRKHSPGN